MPYFFRNRPDTILQWTWALSRNILSAAGSAGTGNDCFVGIQSHFRPSKVQQGAAETAPHGGGADDAAGFPFKPVEVALHSRLNESD